MMHRWKFGRALPVAVSLFAAEAIAETDYEWRFDTSGRAAKIVEPTVTDGTNSSALEWLSWTEGTCHGIKTRGLYLIIR